MYIMAFQIFDNINTIKIIGFITSGFLKLIIKNSRLIILLTKKIKTLHTDNIFPRTICNFGNSDINNKEVKSFHAKEFLIKSCVYKTATMHKGMMSS